MSVSAFAERGLSSLWNGFGRLEVEETGQTKAPSVRERREDIHKDTAAELARRLLDDPIDRDLVDVEDGEHGGGKDEQDGLCELFARARTIECAGHKDVRGDDHGHDAHGKLTGDRSQMRS